MEALKVNNTLLNLTLWYNNISDEGAMELVKACDKKKKFYLGLLGNKKITERGKDLCHTEWGPWSDNYDRKLTFRSC